MLSTVWQRLSHVVLHLSLVALVALLLVRLWPGRTIASNIAWISLNKAAKSGSIFARRIALGAFQFAVTADDTAWREWSGLALAHLYRDEQDLAFEAWQASKVEPNALILMGEHRLAQGNYNEALLFYQGAAKLERASNNGYYAIGELCQLVYGQVHLVDVRTRTFCLAYFEDNQNNLLLNPQFNEVDIRGWEYQRIGYQLNHDERTGERYAELIADYDPQSDGLYRGFYQLLTLPPESHIRFSAWINLMPGDMAVRVLHVGWKDLNGRSDGTSLIVITETDGWTYFERSILVPPAEQNQLRFSPVLLDGEGVVAIDQVRLEVLPEE